MSARVIVLVAAVLALGYGVMLFRLWRRTGRARVSSFGPQSALGRVRVLVLAAVGIAILSYFVFARN